MDKLKANTRFYNVFDGKIYDDGDVFSTSNKDEKDYLLQHKIVSAVKEEKEKTAKPKK